MAVAYLGMAWVISQVSSLALDSFEAPGWIIKAILLLLVICFPIALILAWAYEITPEGLKLTDAVDPSKSITAGTGKKLNFLIVAILGITVIGLLIDRSRSQSKMLNPVEVLTEPAMNSIQRQLKDKKVAVLPFTNNTNSEELQAYGALAADYITEGLMHVAANQVINLSNTDDISMASIVPMESQKILNRRGAEVIVQGRYYLQETDLIVHCNIVEAATGNTIKALKPIKGPRSQMMELLEELQERILGYWEIGGIKRYEGKPPKYSAYQTFLKGDEAHSNNPRKAVEFFLKAHEQDTTWYEPIAKMFASLANLREYDLMDSILVDVRSKDPDLTLYEELRFQTFEALIERDLEKRARICQELFEEFPNDHTAAYMAAFTSVITYRPHRAIKLGLEKYPGGLSKCKTCWTHIQLLHAWTLLGEFDKIIKYEDSSQIADENAMYLRFVIQALAYGGHHERVEEMLRIYSRKTTYNPVGEFDPINYLRSAMRGYYGAKNDSMVQHYGSQYLAKLSPDQLSDLYETHYMMGNYEEALRHAKTLYEEESGLQEYSRLAIVYEALGDISKSEQWMDSIRHERFRDNINLPWSMTMIHAARGDKQKTLQSLAEHIDLGQHAAWRLTGNAHWLRDIYGSPEYLDVVIKSEDREVVVDDEF